MKALKPSPLSLLDDRHILATWRAARRFVQYAEAQCREVQPRWRALWERQEKNARTAVANLEREAARRRARSLRKCGLKLARVALPRLALPLLSLGKPVTHGGAMEEGKPEACLTCGKAVERGERGPRGLYCSPACRQRAYRARQKAEREAFRARLASGPRRPTG